MNTPNHPDTTTIEDESAYSAPSGPDKYTVTHAHKHETLRHGDIVVMSFHDGSNVLIRPSDATIHRLADRDGQYVHLRKASTHETSPPEIAPGHNPAGLTVEQIPSGRRLMTEEEVRRDRKNHRRQQGEIWWWIDKSKWDEGAYWMNGNDPENTYCVPIDWVDPLLPKPKRTVPWDKPEDVPGPVCYLRHYSWPQGECQIVNAYSVFGLQHCGRTGNIDWYSLFAQFTHSTDRKTWLPCTKEVEG